MHRSLLALPSSLRRRTCQVERDNIANLTEDDIVRQLSNNREPLKAAQKAFDKLKRRKDELDRIIRKIVEQNALGEITTETFTMLYSGYINEQNALVDKMKDFEAQLAAENSHKDNARMFVDQIRKYTAPNELSREMILDLIDKIAVHEPTGSTRDGTRQQVIEFHYRFIGQLPDSTVSL